MPHKIAGFSLVELMVVVSIVGILAMLAVPRYHGFIAQARRGEAKSNLAHLANLQEMYKAEHGAYYDGAAMKNSEGIGYKNEHGTRGDCEDYSDARDEGLSNKLGFRPQNCRSLRYFYQMRGAGEIVAFAYSDAERRYVYPDCDGGGPVECLYGRGDAVKLALSDAKPVVCRNITKYCPSGAATPPTPPPPVPPPPPCTCNCSWALGTQQTSITDADLYECQTSTATSQRTDNYSCTRGPAGCVGGAPCPAPTTRTVDYTASVQGTKPIDAGASIADNPCDCGAVSPDPRSGCIDPLCTCSTIPSACPASAPATISTALANNYTCQTVTANIDVTTTCTPASNPPCTAPFTRASTMSCPYAGTKDVTCANLCGDWGEWGAWGACEENNGSHEKQRTRSRTCAANPCSTDITCPTTQMGKEPCPSCTQTEEQACTALADATWDGAVGCKCDGGKTWSYDGDTCTGTCDVGPSNTCDTALNCCDGDTVKAWEENSGCTVEQWKGDFTSAEGCCEIGIPQGQLPCDTALNCCDGNTVKAWEENSGCTVEQWKGDFTSAEGCCETTPTCDATTQCCKEGVEITDASQCGTGYTLEAFPTCCKAAECARDGNGNEITTCRTNSFKTWLGHPDCRCGDCRDDITCNTDRNDWDGDDCECTPKQCGLVQQAAKLLCLSPDIWHEWSPTAPSCECEDVTDPTIISAQANCPPPDNSVCTFPHTTAVINSVPAANLSNLGFLTWYNNLQGWYDGMVANNATRPYVGTYACTPGYWDNVPPPSPPINYSSDHQWHADLYEWYINTNRIAKFHYDERHSNTRYPPLPSAWISNDYSHKVNQCPTPPPPGGCNTTPVSNTAPYLSICVVAQREISAQHDN